MKKIKIVFLLLLCSTILCACSLPGIGGNVKKEIVIASGNTSERKIITEITAQMIKHYSDLDVTIVNNLGSTTLINVAMLNKDVNVVGGMYTGTSLTGELGLEPIRDKDEALKTVQKEYLKRYNRIWYPSLGFENTYAFMVTEDFSKKYNVKKVSDLKKLKDKIKVGVDTTWMTRKGDGYEDFKKIYEFSFKKIYPMDIGLVYTALNNKEMDVALGYSTDGRINSYNLILLEDDLNLFPGYDCSLVASKDIVDKYPILNEIFSKLNGNISSKTMQRLNRKSDEDLLEPRNVAKEFLEENNYFESVKVKK